MPTNPLNQQGGAPGDNDLLGRMLAQLQSQFAYQTLKLDPTTGALDPASMAAMGASGVTRPAALANAIQAHKDGLRARPPIVFGIGDSNTGGNGAGLGTGTVPRLAGAQSRGPFMQMKTTQGAVAGLRLCNTSFFGESNVTSGGEPVSEYDPRLTLSGGWTPAGTPSAIGGRWFETPNTSGEFRCAFGERIDTVEIYYIAATGSPTINVMSSDGTVTGSFSCAGAAGIGKYTVSSSKFNDGVVRLKNNAAGAAYLLGMIAYPTNEKVVVLAMGAFEGAGVAAFADTSSPWTGVLPHTLIAPDLTFTQLTLNDTTAGTSASAYGTNLTAIFNTLTLCGDNIFVAGHRGQAANFYNSVGSAIVQKAKTVCASFGVEFIDMGPRFDNWTSSNAAGYQYDANHMTYSGYTKQSIIYAKCMLGMAN
jgi:hypothetical protein